MTNLLRNLLMALGIILLSSCACHSGQDEKSIDYYYSLLTEASSYVYTLKDRGQLPGVSKDEHGHFDIFSEPLWDAQRQSLKQPIIFPVTFTVNLTPTQGVPEYRYKITKASKHADWQLNGAWRKLQDGKLEEVKK